MKSAIERLIEAIGYPERAPEGARSFTLQVDGADVLAEERSGRLRLSLALSDDENLLPKFAAYAAGRMLREEATLAYGKGLVFLWQDASVDADDRTLVRLFESFTDSCDWWRARVDERGKGDAVEISEAVIRP